MTTLEARGLSVEYVMAKTQQRVPALKGLSMQVQQGEFVAIVGPSGCGKTTLLKVLAGLLPPQAGMVAVDGRPIAGPGRERALIPQTAALLPWRTVLGNVSYGLELQGVARREAQSRARHFIDLVGLSAFEESFPRELSGGMQQRANVARALAVEPAILLLDEPLASLDAQTRERMQSEIHDLWMQTRHTAILVTHSIREAIYLADRVAIMSGPPGRIDTVIPVTFERPRSERTRQDPAFHALEMTIKGLLQ